MIDLGRKRAWYFLWEKISSLTSESITAFMKFITAIRALHHRHEYHRCCRFRSTIWVCRDRHEDQQCYKSPPPLELSISDTRRFSIRLWISVHISSCSHHLPTCISPFWYVQQFISKARLHRHHIFIFIIWSENFRQHQITAHDLHWSRNTPRQLLHLSTHNITILEAVIGGLLLLHRDSPSRWDHQSSIFGIDLIIKYSFASRVQIQSETRQQREYMVDVISTSCMWRWNEMTRNEIH